VPSWFVDASVLLATEDAEDENYEDSVWLLEAKERIATLDLAYYEVSNVAVKAWRDEAAAQRLRERVSASSAERSSLSRRGQLLVSGCQHL
jgi:predicted nucleic acid-binding protein